MISGENKYSSDGLLCSSTFFLKVSFKMPTLKVLSIVLLSIYNRRDFPCTLSSLDGFKRNRLHLAVYTLI